MRDGTYVDPLGQSGAIPLAVLGLSILILAACFIFGGERRVNRYDQSTPQPDPIDVAQQFHDDLDNEHFAVWEHEMGRSA